MGYILTTYKLVSRISEPSTVCSCRCSGVVVPLWPLAVICRCSLQLLRWEPYSWKPPKFPSWLQFIQQSLRSQAWGMLRNANLEAQLRTDFPIFLYYHEGWLLLFAQGAAAEFHDFAKTLWRGVRAPKEGIPMVPWPTWKDADWVGWCSWWSRYCW